MREKKPIKYANFLAKSAAKWKFSAVKLIQ
jgi:hypothetical protein